MLCAVVVLMRFWKPRRIATPLLPGDADTAPAIAPAGATSSPAWNAWLPWIFLTVFVFAWGLPPVKSQLNAWFAPQLPVPLLHLVQKVPPVAPKPTPKKPSSTSTCSRPPAPRSSSPASRPRSPLGSAWRRALGIYGHTLLRVRVSLLTISVMMALGFTTRYSGTDTTMGLAMAGTGGCSRSSPRSSAGSAWRSPAATRRPTSSSATSRKSPPNNSALAAPHVRRQQLRRRHGQDDRRPEHRRRQRRHRRASRQSPTAGTVFSAPSSGTASPSPC
jgi:hypothetical protein